MGANEYFELIQSIRLDLLDLFGSGYVIDHCISALSRKGEKAKEHQEMLTCMNYFADCIKIITENTAKSVRQDQEGSYVTRHLNDLLDPDRAAEPERSGDEIAADIIRRAGLVTKSDQERGGGEGD